MHLNQITRRSLALALALALALPGAVPGAGKSGKKNFKEGVKHATAQQWDMAAQEFALAVAAEPDNTEYRLHYYRALQHASIMFVKRGDTLAEQNDFASAYSAYRQAASYDPSNELARVKMQRMLEEQRPAGAGEGVKYNPRTGAALTPAGNQIAPASRRGPSREPLQAVSYNNAGLKASISNLGKQLGLNVLFDETVRENPFSISLQNVSLPKAFDMVLLQNKLTFEQVDRRTILIYQDNQQNRLRFEKLMVKTFYIGNSVQGAGSSLDEMRTAIQAIIGGQRQILAVKQLNALVVRASPTEVQLVQELIENLDKNKAEVVVDVNIYEVANINEIKIGNQVAIPGTNAPAVNAGNLGGLSLNTDAASSGILRNVIYATGPGALLALPPTSLAFLQSKSKTKLLASSQIHALDGQQNQTKVGRSVPVSTGTNYGYGSPVVVPGQGGQGQTPSQVNPYQSGLFNNIQYRDVGLVIDVTPTISNEGYVEIKMKLETTNVEAGPDPLNPVFTQRSLQTVSRVLDGTTAVVAGVQQDIQTNSRSGLAFIGMVPILGRFFVAPQQNNTQSDIVITVTPHIARAAEIKKDDHLARFTGAMQSPLSMSVEEVLYRAQEEEEQERKIIAAQTGQPVSPLATAGLVAQTTRPTAADPAPPASSAVTQSAPPPRAFQNVGQNIGQSVGQSPAPSTPSGAPVVAASLTTGGAPERRPAPQGPAAIEVQKTPSVSQVAGQGERAAGPPPARAPERPQPDGLPEDFDPNQHITQPSQPVAPARVVASRRPENIERLAQEGLKQKEQEADKGKPELRAEVPPETARAATGSQQPVAPAAVKSPARDPRVTLNLAPAPAMPQVGKEVTLTLAFEGRAPLAGGQLSLSFDPGKLKLKAVRDGGLLGEGAEVGHQVSGGTLTLTLKPGAGAERTSGALVVVEFVALAEGQTTVKLDSDASQLRLAGNLAAQLTATAAQFQIAK